MVGFTLLRDLEGTRAIRPGLFLVTSRSVQVAQEREPYLCYFWGV
jgi:hypothetical protein